MKNSIQKSTILVIAITSILLASGSVLMAGDRAAGGLITAADLAFINAAPAGIATRVVPERQIPSAGLISPADYAFAAGKYSEQSGNLQVQVTPETVGIITAADYRFLTTGPAADVFSAHSDFSDSLAGHLAK